MYRGWEEHSKTINKYVKGEEWECFGDGKRSERVHPAPMLERRGKPFLLKTEESELVNNNKLCANK